VLSAVDYETPDYTADLDVDAYIARCPADATAKGMFLTACVDLARRSAPSRTEEVFDGLSRRRWTPFLDYSLRDTMRIHTNVARIRWPREPLREGLRRFGWTAYPTFAESSAGRLLFGVLNRDFEGKFSLMSRGIAISVSHARVTPHRVGERHWRVEYEDVFCFLDCYHVGIIEGVARAHGLTANIMVKLRSPESGTLDVRW
jgi:uncharacterized protein (TIGR02265 family)